MDGTGGLKKKGEESFGAELGSSPKLNWWWRWSERPSERPLKPE